jgi:integrase
VAAYLTEHAPSLKNQAKLRADLALCFGWYEGRTMGQLAEVVKEYAADNAGLKPATVRVRMAYLRAACRWAWKHKGLGQHDPAERVSMPKVRNERHTYIDRRQVLTLARALPRDARAFVLIAFYSGMRRAEIARAVPTDKGWLLADTKNGERRLVPIHRRTAHLARRWPCGLSLSTLQHQFKAATERVGLVGVRFHDLRHSTASALLAADVDLYTVGGILGHKSTQSTARYAHLSGQAMAKAIGAL